MLSFFGPIALCQKRNKFVQISIPTGPYSSYSGGITGEESSLQLSAYKTWIFTAHNSNLQSPG